MFNRKSQTILSDHYSKLIDRSDEPSASADGGDDFITLKRADHVLDEDNLPESFHLSKRKLKMGQSKKAMLSSHGNPTRLVFDDDGDSHQIYELAGEEDFKADGDAKAQQQAFVEAEREALMIADVEDKERAKEKRREKKRKRKDRDAEEVRCTCFCATFERFADASSCFAGRRGTRVRADGRRWVRLARVRRLVGRLGRRRRAHVRSQQGGIEEEAEDGGGTEGGRDRSRGIGVARTEQAIVLESFGGCFRTQDRSPPRAARSSVAPCPPSALT